MPIPCFYVVGFVKDKMNGHFSRPSLSRSLLLVFAEQPQTGCGLSNAADELFSSNTLSVKPVRFLVNFFRTTLGSFMKRRGITSNKLLSVLVDCQTPNIVFARRREKLFRSGPIYTSVPKRETRMSSRAAHTKAEERKRKECGYRTRLVSFGLLRGWRHTPNIASLSWSDSPGRATNNLCASATMPIRRTRLLPLAKRF